ncbi:MAG: NAD(P)-dependent oxidoreductase [Micavibrio aeruginosavorus]|uniref:NAD(P)-dependent oxidoreductase n=1 Tax=Micavibrio aeruginosavorus TaxID=349221 RepID=A0A2W5HJA0_9BACT|nr:MAG: NAD(P)-dependent oxidoreductase [Micavibrio aeruginosavorus]
MYKPKIVFITGATGDFGKAFARKFADLGCVLILHGRNAEKLESLRQEFSVPVHTALFDITDRAAMEQAITELPSPFKNIELLINNAGGALGLEKAQESSLDDWDQMVAMNVSGLMRMTRLLLPIMIDRKCGHIINIGSTAGNYPYPGGHVYCASKAFVKQFSLSLRSDLQGTNIRVTNIEPGMVQTQFSLARFKGDAQKANAVYANTTPLMAEDVAESVVWAATLPPHVNINRIEMMPTTQSPGALQVERL